MKPEIRIGNQTAIACADPMEPFEFALLHGFKAFEWFADKKLRANGTVSGWVESDLDEATRSWIRDTGTAHDLSFTVHAPWQANPLVAEGVTLLNQSLKFAGEIGAGLVNLHLYMEEGAKGYVQSLEPVIRVAVEAGLRLSIENTPHTTPGDFNEVFQWLNECEANLAGSVGMCFDMGHANLCEKTRNDFLGYFDALVADVPIIHLHVHENFGDADSHLTLFTGPSRKDDTAVKGFLNRLVQRQYQGALILEQWPHPAQLLVEAANRLEKLLSLPITDRGVRVSAMENEVC